jgi:hypothetical protein
MISFGTFAQSISASASTGPRRSQNCRSGRRARRPYKITSAQFNNRVHMTAELTK